MPSDSGHQNGHMGGSGGPWRRPQPAYSSNGPLSSHQDGGPSSADLMREFPSLRPSSGFDEQQGLLRVWYSTWSPAERLVALCGMIEQLADTQATLLRNLLQTRLQHKPGLLMKEARANKPDVIYRECSVSPPEQTLDFLQDHLPLLALTNHEAKPLYLNGVLRAVRAAMKGGGGAPRLEQARQLLGLLAVHPVLTRDDNRVVQGLFAEFAGAASGGGGGGPSPDRRGAASLLVSDQRRHSACAAFGGELRVPSPAFSPPQEPPAAWPGRNLLSPSHASEAAYSSEQQLQQAQQRLRSNSLTPPGTYKAPAGDLHPGDLLMAKPRSSSIHLDHSPLGAAPPPAVTSCGASGAAGQTGGNLLYSHVADKRPSGGQPPRSNSHSSLSDICRDKAFSVRGSGTTTVPKWLHKLRLHKYTWIFAGLTYEELFEVSMEKLLSLGVTQGGANKLLRNIQELHDRAQKLKDLEQGLTENKISLTTALEVMQVMVVSPMRPHKPRLSPSPVPPTSSAAGTPLIRVTRSDDSEETAPGGPGGPGAAAGAQGDLAAGDTDLQALMTRVLAKMCTQLLVTQSADDEAIQTFLWVLDEATWHEAFTDAQRRKFVTWKRQISLELGRRQVFPPPFRRHSDARQYHSQRRHSDARGYPRRFPAPSGSGRAAPPPHSAAFSGGGGYPAPSIGYWGGAPGGGGGQPPPAAVRSRGTASSLSPASHGISFPRRTSLQESVLEVPLLSNLHRTNSGDIYRPSGGSHFSAPPPTYGSGRLVTPSLQSIPAAAPPPPPPPPPPPTARDPAARMDSLESICRSVCETALK